MFTLLSLAGFMLLMAGPETLSYRGKSGDSIPTQGVFTLTLDILGPDAVTGQLRSENTMLFIQRLHVHGEGSRVITSSEEKGNNVQILFDRARVEGTYDNELYQFDFERTSPPENLQKDQFLLFSWALSMGGRHYKLGPKGEYFTGDPNDDAHSEAVNLLIDAPVRLPNHGVKVGEEWANEWTGVRRQEDNDGAFHYRQTASLQEIVENGSRRAHISFETTGRLQIPPGKNTNGEETLLEAKGSIVLDLENGLVIATNSSGTVTSEFKASGVKIVWWIEAKYEEKQ